MWLKGHQGVVEILENKVCENHWLEGIFESAIFEVVSSGFLKKKIKLVSSRKMLCSRLPV